MRIERRGLAVPTAVVNKIAIATGIPKEGRLSLKVGLQHAVAYAWSADQWQAERKNGRDLKTFPQRIERTARGLLDMLRQASPAARHQVERFLIGDYGHRAPPAGLESAVKDLIEAARLARQIRIRPTRQHMIHQRSFLVLVADTIDFAGGKPPQLNKNAQRGSWLIVVEALRPTLPPGFLNVAPAALATRTRAARRAVAHRKELARGAELALSQQVDNKRAPSERA